MNAEDRVEQRTICNGGGAHNGHADLHNRPDRGVDGGPSRVEGGELVELGDAVDGGDGDAVGDWGSS